MTVISNPRTHLVERAAAALGTPAGFASPVASPPLPHAAPPQAIPQVSAPVTAPGTPAASPPIGLEMLARAGLADTVEQRSRLLEEVMLVQHQILRTVQDTPPSATRNPRLILVTSALPGEGKSFSALNIAAGIARASGRPALLADLDGKRGSLTELLGCDTSPGVRGLAASPATPPAPLVLPTAISGLSFLPYGVPVPGAPAVPSGAAIATALLRLAAAMPDRLIVLDTPPCLSTSEASLLAPVVGQVVMVIQAERAQRGEVEAALDMLETCPALQLLLNRLQMASSDTFASQDYGAYGSTDAQRR
ncbi:protein-tyrosine kinase [Roseomonas rosea]|uniref:Protein-tyrosine kinase n=1 Tax=Muricoccus roseus TaxID=198092 RepID=A0A1M6N9H6_9PROT|nr:hypothetical protein [Roseomonas rosea]SHJ92395.1 protein-tyrosine kinase [Roseomonas rosea]